MTKDAKTLEAYPAPPMEAFKLATYLKKSNLLWKIAQKNNLDKAGN
jgi:hypothetical protein